MIHAMSHHVPPRRPFVVFFLVTREIAINIQHDSDRSTSRYSVRTTFFSNEPWKVIAPDMHPKKSYRQNPFLRR